MHAACARTLEALDPVVAAAAVKADLEGRCRGLEKKLAVAAAVAVGEGKEPAAAAEVPAAAAAELATLRERLARASLEAERESAASAQAVWVPRGRAGALAFPIVNYLSTWRFCMSAQGA